MKKSSFKYWFAHWCAFNLTAINLHVWKPRFLFHDWEKPWLKLIYPYEKVRRIHRRYSRHHWESIHKIDHLAVVIDWECSRLSKPNETMTAREYFEKRKENFCTPDKNSIEQILNRLNL